MKISLLSSSGFVICCGLQASEPGSLAFGAERIGVPPLSLSDSVVSGAVTKKAHSPGTGLPDFSADVRPNLGLNLLPQRPQILTREAAALRSRTPRVSRVAGMPVIEPSEAVDYKCVVVPPNASVDFKMVVKDPTAHLNVQPPK